MIIRSNESDVSRDQDLVADLNVGLEVAARSDVDVVADRDVTMWRGHRGRPFDMNVSAVTDPPVSQTEVQKISEPVGRPINERCAGRSRH